MSIYHLNHNQFIMVKNMIRTIILTGICLCVGYLVLNQSWAQGVSFEKRELFQLYPQYQYEAQQHKKYKNEHDNNKHLKVRYFTLTEQAQHRVYVKHGRLVDTQGRVLDPQLETNKNKI